MALSQLSPFPSVSRHLLKRFGYYGRKHPDPGVAGKDWASPKIWGSKRQATMSLDTVPSVVCRCSAQPKCRKESRMYRLQMERSTENMETHGKHKENMRENYF